MKRMLRSDWEPHLGFTALVPQEKFSFWPSNKSLIDQAWSVEIAGYRPRFFALLYFSEL